MDHAREKPPFVTRSFLLHGKSLLAMIGPEAKIGTSAIPFHLTTLVPPRTDATTNDVPQFHRRFFPPPPFLFGKLYESPSLERKNYEEDESFFVSILEGKKGLCYSWIMLFSIRRTEFSHRLVNCCSMKKWRDKSFAESLNAASNSARLSSI